MTHPNQTQTDQSQNGQSQTTACQHAVIVVDLQNEYLPSGHLPLVGIGAAVQNAAQIITQARAQGVPVIHIRHEAADANATVFKPGTDHVNIQTPVQPEDNETVILKHYPNSFRETSLQQRLTQMGVTQLTVIGAMSYMCIDATVRAAVDMGYTVTVAEDACATRNITFGEREIPAAQAHATIMAGFEFAYAQVVTTETLLKTWAQ